MMTHPHQSRCDQRAAAAAGAVHSERGVSRFLQLHLRPPIHHHSRGGARGRARHTMHRASVSIHFPALATTAVHGFLGRAAGDREEASPSVDLRLTAEWTRSRVTEVSARSAGEAAGCWDA